MSTEHEAHSRVFYDHEEDEPRGRARRRRPVADWGVEVDSFDRMPSRRFSRRGEPSRPAPVSRTIVIERDPGDEWDREVEAPRPRPAADEPRAPIAAEPPAPAPAPRAAEIEPDREPIVGYMEEPPKGRRTVVIGGHPDRLPLPRNRPPRTAIERIGPRPDRIVAYSVALGMLLILIAILTSH
jgi:hypothetical protein